MIDFAYFGAYQRLLRHWSIYYYCYYYQRFSIKKKEHLGSEGHPHRFKNKRNNNFLCLLMVLSLYKILICIHSWATIKIYHQILFLWRLASVIAPQSSIIKSSVNSNASKSELSIASAKSIEFVLLLAKSQICRTKSVPCEKEREKKKKSRNESVR